ncbi:GNAT family N-acetyltransferase [Silanimonas sp.]|jgi:RimJ/RimL family protein N-acetyltransferase|uniref:GNAT family N-acetyltransferase n=1 Tax=Silanimonas sp. TaxID=1929290 RepID=UPI0037C93184
MPTPAPPASTLAAPPASTLAAPPFRLRPFAEGDLALYAALFTDVEVMRAVGEPFAPDRAARAAAASLRHQGDAGGRFRHWIIEHPQGSAGLLGLALRGEAWRGGEAELGVLLWPAWQARGAATAAITAVRPWAFDIAGLAVLTCHHAEAHAGAAALMRRVGFTPCLPRADAPLPVGWESRPRATAPALG